MKPPRPPASPGGGPTDIERRFADVRPRLQARRRRLLQAILDSPDETFHLSSREMARRYDVDPATIVRTVQALGYRKFADFSSDLRNHFVARITPYTVMKATARERRSIADHVRHSVEHDLQNLHTLANALDIPKVQALARQISRARRISVVGVDLAASLAYFLAYLLQVLGFDASAPTGSAGNLWHHVKHLRSKDLLIAVSFRRGLRETVDAVLSAQGNGVPTFGITDSDLTPIAHHCDEYLVASTASDSFGGSYVAPMALFNAILVACAHQDPGRSLAILREHEQEYVSGPRWFQERPPARPAAATPPAGGNGDDPAGPPRARRR